MYMYRYMYHLFCLSVSVSICVYMITIWNPLDHATDPHCEFGKAHLPCKCSRLA